MEPTTPADWLPILAGKLDAQRVGLDRPRRYARGEADLPEMGKNLRASWEAFQKKARTDYGGAALRSLRNRIRPNGVRIGRTHDHPALEYVRRIELDNGARRQVKDAIRDALETPAGYLTVRVADDGEVLFRREKPEQFYAVPDPVKPWKARVTLKVWRDDLSGRDYARVTIPNASQLFARRSVNENGSPINTNAGGDWQPVAEPDEFDGDAHTVILDAGGPFLAPHFDVIDRINLGKLQRLVTTAMQAFRQRALRSKDGGPLPDQDENGNDLDLARVFEPAPGALWELPEGFDIWESQQTDITPMLNGEKQDTRDFAAATGTPISALLPEGENQSAEGAANAKEQQIEQARDIIEMVSPAVALAWVYALRAAGADLGGDEVEVLFAPPEHVSLSEKYAAAVQAKGAGLAGRTIKRDILGMTPDQIEQDEADAGADMLAAALIGGARQAAQEQAPAAAQDAQEAATGGADTSAA